MRIGTLVTLLSVVMLCTGAKAADLSGTWQNADQGQHVLKITKAHDGFVGHLFNLGEEAPSRWRNGNSISAITLQGQHVGFSLDRTGGIFDGELAPDGNSITGTWQTVYRKQPQTWTRATKESTWLIDPSPHKTLFVPVQKGVQLEVLDWGGSGPPLIFLSGLGGTAHEFDGLAPKFTDHHHVYAITRRGFGLSSSPPPTDENYDADRLGDDVLAVINALKLQRPVLAGHSVAGEELSSIGTRHPEKVAGLIYLDALFAFSLYDPALADLLDDPGPTVSDMRRDLVAFLEVQQSPEKSRAVIADMQALMPRLQKEIQTWSEQLDGFSEPPLSLFLKPADAVENRITLNYHRYALSPVPILALVAAPLQCQPNCDKPLIQQIAARDIAKADFVEKHYPAIHLVRLPYANHYIWRSDEARVEQEMNAFMDGLR